MPPGQSRSDHHKSNGKAPEGYAEAMAHWCAEVLRVKGSTAHVNGEDGKHLKNVLALHPLAHVKPMMTHLLTRTRLEFIRKGHRYTLRALDSAWPELWSEAKARAAEEGEPWP